MLRVLKRLGEEVRDDCAHAACRAYCSAGVCRTRAEYVRWIAEELIPRLPRWAGAVCDAFCDDHAFTVDETRTVLTAARRHGLRLRVHAEQFRPGTGAALAAELGAATATTEWRLRIVCASCGRQGQPVLLPGSVFALGRTIIRLRA